MKGALHHLQKVQLWWHLSPMAPLSNQTQDGMCLVGSTWLSPFHQQYRYTCCAQELQEPTCADRTEPERILYKAEATGGFLDLVQTHDNPLDISALGEELLDLLLGGVEGQVADIQRGGNLQGFLLQLPAPLRAQRRTPRAQRARRPAPTALRPPAAQPLARPCPGLSPPRPGRAPPPRRAGAPGSAGRGTG